MIIKLPPEPQKTPLEALEELTRLNTPQGAMRNIPDMAAALYQAAIVISGVGRSPATEIVIVASAGQEYAAPLKTLTTLERVDSITIDD